MHSFLVLSVGFSFFPLFVSRQPVAGQGRSRDWGHEQRARPRALLDEAEVAGHEVDLVGVELVGVVEHIVEGAK